MFAAAGLQADRQLGKPLPSLRVVVMPIVGALVVGQQMADHDLSEITRTAHCGEQRTTRAPQVVGRKVRNRQPRPNPFRP